MTERIVAAFVPLVDCAVLVAAREQGFAAEAGIDLVLVKEPSWASLRDHLCLGHVDCAHALAPLPVALTLGVGHVQVDCIAPFVLGPRWQRRDGFDAACSTRCTPNLPRRAWTEPARGGPRAGGRRARSRASPLTLGMVFPFSNHNFDLRYWLAAAGVHPDRDVRLVAIPPPLMVDSLRAGLVDGFCVGEPWNTLAVDPRGRPNRGDAIAVVPARRREGARDARIVRASEQTFSTDCCKRSTPPLAWVDDASNHSALAALLARSEYLGVPPESIAAALDGRLHLGLGAAKRDVDFMYFHRHAANAPRAADGLWVYAQMVRWGQLAPSAQAQRAAAEVFRPDLYRQSLPAAPCAVPAPEPFDRIEFVATDVRAYLGEFAVQTPFADSHSL